MDALTSAVSTECCITGARSRHFYITICLLLTALSDTITFAKKIDKGASVAQL